MAVAGSVAAKRESFGSYERAQERAVAYTVLARRRTLAGCVVRTERRPPFHLNTSTADRRNELYPRVTCCRV